MIEFQWPWLLLLLPIPVILYRWLPAAANNNEAALRVPDADLFHSNTGPENTAHISSRSRLLLIWIAWALLLLAAARPVWVGDPIELPVSGRDLMLAVDLSGSMEVEDFIYQGQAINRLQATQMVAGEFIKRRIGDRLGLILFGRNAYLQTPLTFDRTTVRALLDEAVIGLAGQETAIGDAIGLAVKHLRAEDINNQVLVLLTDGANTAGEVTPLKAAELAAESGLKIYTIGIGADEMIVRSFFGRQRINPSRDLDETTLRKIAESTGGRYFRARDTDDLNQIYDLLDEIEPVSKEQKTYRPQQSIFYWPLAAALLISSILLLIRYSRGYRQ
ncbi:MAG: VWA domain-containing protein [Gammaproteobacteria bacterium]|nr:VWA domain-containing protein [Gammaproteobacteria bacterium]